MKINLKEHIRNIKDFPKKGIVFRDITTLLKSPDALKFTFEQLCKKASEKKFNKIVGIESRGFIFGAMLAEKFDVGFVPARKPGKLPAPTESFTYKLEYGTDSIEIHKDAISQGDKVIVHDDLIATGGTADAVCKLVEKLGGQVVQVSFIIDLAFLNGKEKLKKYNVISLVTYDSE